MDTPFFTPDLWFRAGIPRGKYADEVDVDHAYLPVRESFREGGGPPADQAASFLAWTILRDGLYRPTLAVYHTAFLQDGAQPEPDVEVELNMATTREDLGSDLDEELADLLGEPPAVSPAQGLTPYQRRQKYHPAAGMWEQMGEVTKWRQRLSERHARMWEWIPPVVWAAVTALLFLLVWAGVPTNPVGGWLVSTGWPVPIVLAAGAALVRRRAVRLRDEVQSKHNGSWRETFRRDTSHIGHIRVRAGWPLWVWGYLTLALLLALPLAAAAVISLAVLWSPALWPKEQRRRLVGTLRRQRPPLTLTDLRDPHSRPDPVVPLLELEESIPVAAASPSMAPQLSRMSQPIAHLTSLTLALEEVAEFAELPAQQATPAHRVVGALLLEMWCAATGSAMPYWGARFGVWSADVIGTAAAFAFGHGDFQAPAAGSLPAPSRCVAPWWEQEAQGLRAIAVRHLGAEQASAALLTAAHVFLPDENSHIPRMVRLRAETLVYAARAAAHGAV